MPENSVVEISGLGIAAVASFSCSQRITLEFYPDVAVFCRSSIAARFSPDKLADVFASSVNNGVLTISARSGSSEAVINVLRESGSQSA